MPETLVCLIRHGETSWNLAQRIQGHTDIELTAAGLHQAALAARWVSHHLPVTQRPQWVYSSDLLRARQTAGALAESLALPVRELPAFRERCYGCFEGLTYEEARTQYPEDYARFACRDPDRDLPLGGESLRAFSARVIGALQALCAAHPGAVLAVVTHGGVLDAVNRFVRGLPLEAPRDFTIPNTGLNWVRTDGVCWHIESWAETAHLEASALDELKAL